ncbi:MULTISPECIES: response regulator transcription factor [Snodgrassella]|uniref:response regulator transcription factor n=1 Tax=Snodgrassella TaxID=1193515 RepID=UPI000A04646C|nr:MULTISPECIES: response regulator transcription factor [Snodgrassella]MBI0097591.1 response regulator transcription factor [Snodgrassella sp. W8134]MBI0100676.1 response regulator transcription factor [Snodgrassella sp. W8135]MBI0128862.1 response regulator transcription factor [Snodgrassella sp. W8124]MBI0165580.1 response regulator transcription factor [Snodgrassella sp. M0351]MBI0180693.1 response regulator transcription factor [Snodgrassella sp. W8158]
MNRVLLIDDDNLLTELLTEYLTAEGLEVSRVADGEAGVKEILTGQYDVVVLDSMMPKMNGLDVLKTVRVQSKIPIIMLTAKGDDIDRIIGLEMGADDYVPKPCQPRELLARINAILRRTHQSHDNDQNGIPNSISASGVVLYPAKRQVTIEEEPLELTSTEFNLLEVLMRHAGQVVSKETLSLEALDRKLAKFDRSIDVHISSIRHKLGNASLIQTVRGLGYLFVKN